MPTLLEIESRCRLFAEERSLLAAAVKELNDEMESVKRKRLPRIKRLIADAAGAHSLLKADLEAAPALFEKPRTHVFHGIKVGYQKGRGGIEIADEDRTIARIKELLDRPENYIRTIEQPNKKALAQLPVADLKKVGCTVVNTTDEIVIEPTDSAVDKIVSALLKDAIEDAEKSAS